MSNKIHKYWIHYIVYIAAGSPDQEAMEGSHGLDRNIPITDFDHILAIQVELQAIIRARMRIPDPIALAVTVIGWQKLEADSRIIH
jgi:hypothetical protein